MRLLEGKEEPLVLLVDSLHRRIGLQPREDIHDITLECLKGRRGARIIIHYGVRPKSAVTRAGQAHLDVTTTERLSVSRQQK